MPRRTAPRTPEQKAARRAAYQQARAKGLTRKEARKLESSSALRKKLGQHTSVPRHATKTFGRFPTFAQMEYPFHYVTQVRLGRSAGETRVAHITIVSGSPLTYDEVERRVHDKVARDAHGHYEGEHIWAYRLTEAERWE